MLESLVALLIYLVVLGIVFYLVIYVLGMLGVTVPPRVIQLVGVLVLLLAILWFLQGGVTLDLHMRR